MKELQAVRGRRRPAGRLGPRAAAVLCGLLFYGCSVTERREAEWAAPGRGFEASTAAPNEAPGEPEKTGAAAKEGLTAFVADQAGAAGASGREEAGGASGEAEAAKRLVIYTANLQILVPSVEEAIQRFVRAAEEAGGWLQVRQNARVVCRVPAARFKEVLAQVRTLGRVLAESVNALEVTREYRDLEIRIATAEKALQRLLALLERAEKTEDILKIEAEIRRLTEEIERMKGELRLLRDRIAYSTIECRFQSSAPEPRPRVVRRRSRFDWINRVGIDHVLTEF